MEFAEAIDDALGAAMSADERIVLFGEDVQSLRMGLFVRFGPRRVRAAPISEAAFVGAAVGAAMLGLRPVVELMMVDFVGVAMDALLNHAAKVEVFSGGGWRAPMVVRAPCGGGYGDGGQHQQALWGWLAHVPGLAVVAPSIPSDAGGLMTAALAHDGPVVFLEHKLLSAPWRDSLGGGGRTGVTFDVPAAGANGPVVLPWSKIPLGRAIVRRSGNELTLISVALGVHRCLEAAAELASRGIEAEVIDLRSIAPLDGDTIAESASRTGRVLVVDEDYGPFGLSGEIAAALLERGVRPRFGRVCTRSTIPYARDLEAQALPNTARILELAMELVYGQCRTGDNAFAISEIRDRNAAPFGAVAKS